MDSITQTLLGVTIAEAGFRKKLGWKALAAGAVLGIAPDLDVFTRVFGPLASMKYHRAETHSFVVLAFLLAVVLLLVLRFAKEREKRLPWVHLAAWVLLTHPVLDWCNTYGTLILAPLSRHRFSLDLISIIDPFYSVPLLIAVFIALFMIIPGNVRKGVAIGALVLSTAYLGWAVRQNLKARGIARTSAAECGIEVSGLLVTPCFFTIYCWRVVVTDPDGDHHVGLVSTWNPRNVELTRLESSRDPLVKEALKTEAGKTFKWFAQDLVRCDVEEFQDGSVVVISDVRFGWISDPLKPVFGMQVFFDEDGNHTGFERTHPRMSISFEKEWDVLWSTVAGNE
jgi:inner membrane protein